MQLLIHYFTITHENAFELIRMDSDFIFLNHPGLIFEDYYYWFFFSKTAELIYWRADWDYIRKHITDGGFHISDDFF